jgi:hypothetical protein
MKKLENIMSSGKKFLCGALLASACFLPQYSHAQEPEKSWFRKFDKIGIELEAIAALNANVGVPCSVIPTYANNQRFSPPVNEYISQSTSAGTTLSIGPRLRLFSIFEGAIGFNLGCIGEGGPGYDTYWGGYGIGDYACIGEVNTKWDPFSYELTLQTPPLFCNSSEEGLRLFASCIKNRFDLYYHSGYHMYGQAFYEDADHFKIGDFKCDNLRFGAKFCGLMEGTEIDIKLFYQKNNNQATLTERGKDFKVDSKQDAIGFGLEFMF